MLISWTKNSIQDYMLAKALPVRSERMEAGEQPDQESRHQVLPQKDRAVL